MVFHVVIDHYQFIYDKVFCNFYNKSSITDISKGSKFASTSGIEKFEALWW